MYLHRAQSARRRHRLVCKVFVRDQVRGKSFPAEAGFMDFIVPLHPFVAIWSWWVCGFLAIWHGCVCHRALAIRASLSIRYRGQSNNTLGNFGLPCSSLNLFSCPLYLVWRIGLLNTSSMPGCLDGCPRCCVSHYRFFARIVRLGPIVCVAIICISIFHQ